MRKFPDILVLKQGNSSQTGLQTWALRLGSEILSAEFHLHFPSEHGLRLTYAGPAPQVLRNRQQRQTCACPRTCHEYEITVLKMSPKLKACSSGGNQLQPQLIFVGRLEGTVVQNMGCGVRLLGVQILALPVTSCVRLGQVTYPLWTWFLITKWE